MLQGANLSWVQTYALEILMALDSKQKADDFYDNLRALIVGSHPHKVYDIFKEWKKPDEEPQQPAPDSVSVPVSEDEHHAIEDLMRELRTGVVTAEEIDHQEGGWL
jgi:predicted lipoprotein